MENTKEDIFEIILASASPRRKEILAKIFPKFKVEVSKEEEENLPFTVFPEKMVEKNAFIKASSVAKKYENKNALIIGSDTSVFLDGKIYSKPKTILEARQMLSELSGKTHSVYTGVCVIKTFCNENGENDKSNKTKTYCFSDRSKVSFKNLDFKMIETYLALIKNPLDRAGSYAIGEANNMIIDSFYGSFTNIMGLPFEKLEEVLKERFF